MEEASVANPLPAQSDSSTWAYACVSCSHQIDVESVQAMPTCPNCNGPCVWEFRCDGENDPDD
jgi:predicted RNA-binding Zn-ribbon protein involved in translation (DUF1610 family)